MKIALCVWQNRIAPVFDVGTALLLVELDGDRVVRREEASVPGDPAGKIHWLMTAGVSELICGAVSRPVRMMLDAGGVRVHDFHAGDADAILAARLDAGSVPETFRMPGCGQRRQKGGGRGRGRQRCKGGRHARF
jgi:predicted Fe-Mo cluster-binding NifX family protein